VHLAGDLDACEERRCASRGGCAHRERRPAAGGQLQWAGALLTQPAGLCEACQWRVECSIGELPADVLELTELIGATGSTGLGVPIRQSRELPSLLRLGVEALRAEIEFEACFWAAVVAQEVGAQFDITACRLPARVQLAAQVLRHRVGTLLTLGPQQREAWTPDGEALRDYWGGREVVAYTGLAGGLHLRELHRRVRQVAGRTKLVHRLTPACPICDQRALVRDNGADQVDCESCGKVIEERHYDWFVQVTIAEQRRRAAA
jgi:ribosomal protein L37AE/L43A